MQLARYTQSHTALGGLATLSLISNAEKKEVEGLLAHLWRKIFYFEKKFSRFLPSSELSRFNKRAGTRVPVSPHMHEVLAATKHYALETAGLYNPFILPALQRSGYHGSAVPGYENDPVPDYSDRHVVSPEKLEIDDDWAYIPHGTALDLGGMGKGYLLDQLADMLQAESHVTGFWLELSGDVITFGHDENNRPISVGIQNARDLTKKHTTMNVQGNGERLAIATSGTFKRDTHGGDENSHHIIDPRTGVSAETDILLATVCSSRALAADIWASCAVIVGSAAAPKLLDEHGINDWVLQYTQDKAGMLTLQGSHIKEVSRA